MIEYEDVTWNKETLAIYKLGMRRVLDVWKKSKSYDEGEHIKSIIELDKMLKDL